MPGGSLYRSASFLTSAPEPRALPADEGLEVAFAGRSNVGKSSVLNTLTGQRGLARTSKTPGRTQLLNAFRLDDSRRLIDLPGYGFARVPDVVRQRWGRSIDAYLRTRRSLVGLVMISDARRPLGTLDQTLFGWVSHTALAVHVILNKSDKLSRGAGSQALRSARAWLEENCPDASCQLFSATRQTGLETLCERLDSWFELVTGDQSTARKSAPTDTAATAGQPSHHVTSR
jgi:GTP-binding protein